MNEHQEKVKAVKALLYCLNDAPFKPEMAGVFWNIESMAEALVKATEQVEIDADERRYEIARANAN